MSKERFPLKGAVGADSTKESVEPEDSIRERCRTDRDSMEPHETADCAGTGIAEAYENEEDGGS